MTKYPRLFILISLSFLFAAVLGAGAFARNDVDGSAVVVPDVEPVLFTAVCDGLVDSFEADVTGWKAENAVSNLRNTDKPSTAPVSPLEGLKCLAVKTSLARFSEVRSVSIGYAQPLDMSEFSTFNFALNCPDIGYAMRVVLTLESLDGSCTVTGALKSGCWNGVFTDISGWSGRSSVMKITIGVGCEPNGPLEDVRLDYSFFLDLAAMSRRTFVEEAMRYLAPHYEYTASGASLALTSDGSARDVSEGSDASYLLITGLSETVSIESPLLPAGISAATGMLRVKLDNRSGAASADVYYADSQSLGYSEERKATVSLTSGLQSCYLPVGADLRRLRIVFSGCQPGGSIGVYSITPASSYADFSNNTLSFTSQRSASGQITSCVISQDHKNIEVTVALDSAVYSRYVDKTLELYELEPYESESEITARRLAPVGQESMRSSHTFSVPLASGLSNRVCRRFVAVINNNGGLLIIASSFVTNPGAAAASAEKYPETKSIKGMLEVPPTAAAGLGIRHTAVQLRLEKLVSALETEDAYLFENTSLYYSASYLAELDAKIKAYTDEGVNVTVVLTTSMTGNAKLDALLCHPSARRTSYAAFNSLTKEGVTTLRAVCDFIARRYSSSAGEHGRAVNYVVGFEVGDAYQNYNLGTVNLQKFTAAYASAFRIIFNTVKAASGGAKLFVSLGCGWNEELPSSETVKYDNSALLDAFSAYIKSAGDIDWNVMYDPYPTTDELYESWNGVETKSLLARRLTPANLEVLTGYLSSQKLMYNGSARSVILYERGFSDLAGETELQRRFAEYAYAFYKASSLGDQILCYMTGLMSDRSGVIEYIDAQNTAEVTYFAREYFNYYGWEDMLPGFSPEDAATHSAFSLPFGAPEGTAYTGVCELWSFGSASDQSGWTAGSGCAELRTGYELAGYGKLLMAGFTAAEDSAGYRYIENRLAYPLDLTEAPFVSFGIQLFQLPASVKNAELTVTFWSGDSYARFYGDVYDGNWTEVLSDLSSFDGVGAIDRVTIAVRASGGVGDIGEPLAAVSTISGSSLTLADDELAGYFESQRAAYLLATRKPVDMRYVWALVIIIIVSSTILIIHIMSGLRESSDKR